MERRGCEPSQRRRRRENLSYRLVVAEVETVVVLASATFAVPRILLVVIFVRAITRSPRVFVLVIAIAQDPDQPSEEATDASWPIRGGLVAVTTVPIEFEQFVQHWNTSCADPVMDTPGCIRKWM